MATPVMDMGFLSSLKNISFPSGFGLIWVQQGVTVLPPVQTAIIAGAPGLFGPWTAINGATPVPALGLPTSSTYGGASKSFLAFGSPIVQNFLAFKLTGAKGITTVTVKFGPSNPFMSLAAGIILPLPYASLKMSSTGSPITATLAFTGGNFKWASGFTPTSTGDAVKAFMASLPNVARTNTITFNRIKKTVTFS